MSETLPMTTRLRRAASFCALEGSSARDPLVRLEWDKHAETCREAAQTAMIAALHVRRCPLHGPMPGMRYCPECASCGHPWTEAQADAEEYSA
jgi:hypothetical protein